MSSGLNVDYLLHSEIAQTLKLAQDKKDLKCMKNLLIYLTKENPDAVIELSNDDWMKDPNVQLPPAVLVGESTLIYILSLYIYILYYSIYIQQIIHCNMLKGWHRVFIFNNTKTCSAFNNTWHIGLDCRVVSLVSILFYWQATLL